MENILQKIALSLASLIALIGSVFSNIPPEAIQPIDPMPEIVVEAPKKNENKPVPKNKPALPKPEPKVVQTQPVPKPVTPPRS